jgi:hypothetical protein
LNKKYKAIFNVSKYNDQDSIDSVFSRFNSQAYKKEYDLRSRSISVITKPTKILIAYMYEVLLTYELALNLNRNPRDLLNSYEKSILNNTQVQNLEADITKDLPVSTIEDFDRCLHRYSDEAFEAIKLAVAHNLVIALENINN